MQKISIGRYKAPESIVPGYAGWIEGTRDDGTDWIMWLDEQGSPCLYYATRDEEGGIVGRGTKLK